MRIIAGKYRRRKLLTNEGLTTRPITDKAKEMVFQRLQSEIEGKKVADIFAGTGTIGLEALSRGAASVIFMERDHKAISLLKENIEKIGVEEPHLCWRVDVLKSSFRPKGVDDLLPLDVIFFDPPYKMVKEIVPGSPLFKSLERLASEECSSENALLIFRTPAKAKFELPEIWEYDRTYQIGTMEIHLYDKNSGSLDKVSEEADQVTAEDQETE